MFGIVDRAEYKGPMKIGIGTPEQEAALKGAGCETVYAVDELRKGEHDSRDPVGVIFRAEDTVIMAQPSVLPLPLMRAISAMGVFWQVVGHEAVQFASEEDRMDWRRLKPRNADIPQAPKLSGPKPKYPIPTDAQIKNIVKHWHSKMKRASVVEVVQDMMGAPVPMSWVRDQVIKATGSAKRSPQ